MPPIQAAHTFGALFIGCGVAALIFNLTIIVTLCRVRRNILSRTFYLLIFNFAIIDLLKSTCSVIWALKMLPVGISTSMYFMKADQFALMILRFANLATILNLLMLTLNEYVYIMYPFHYRRIVNNTRVILLIAICWILAWSFTLSILFVGSRKQSIYIKPDCLMKGKYLSHTLSNDGNYHREFHRAKKQLLKRNKYIIVIGSVLAIYTVYLISYSAIKFLFVSRLKSSRLGLSRTAMYYVRWGFQTLMCLNTLLQPLCYFRMHEFRSAFKTVIFRHNRCESLMAETTYLSITESRRRTVLGNDNRSNKNDIAHTLFVLDKKKILLIFGKKILIILFTFFHVAIFRSNQYQSVNEILMSWIEKKLNYFSLIFTILLFFYAHMNISLDLIRQLLDK
uniref:G_PROTEIN_RECEP_F1_2 domain-containing protein n=1 Tax=Elaeophora elaphi TaxID=1147741 RepID=A0A0R3S6F0_9BILA